MGSWVPRARSAGRVWCSTVLAFPRMRRPIATLACLVLATLPTSGLAADDPEQQERARIDRTWRVGSGLLWGGVGTASAGGLTLLGVIPTQRNLKTAKAHLSLCMLSFPECPAQESEIQRWTRARNAVAITGGVLAVAGLAMVAVGAWKRRTARRERDALEHRTKPEWSVHPSIGPIGAAVTLVARF